MEKLLVFLMIFFAILCFIGVGYVLLYTGGEITLEYAVCPMLFLIIWSHEYIAIKKNSNQN